MPEDRLSQLRKSYAEEDYFDLEPPDLGPLGPPPHGRGYGLGGGVKIAWVPTRRQMT